MTTPDVAEPLSPPSTPTSYIQDCLVAFKADSGIDLVRHKDALAHRDLTPDIIGDVSAFPYIYLGGPPDLFYRFPTSTLPLFFACQRGKPCAISASVANGFPVRKQSSRFSCKQR